MREILQIKSTDSLKFYWIYEFNKETFLFFLKQQAQPVFPSSLCTIFPLVLQNGADDAEISFTSHTHTHTHSQKN